MDEKPIHDERILEALEACRPGSDDVADPLLGPLAAAISAGALAYLIVLVLAFPAELRDVWQTVRIVLGRSRKGPKARERGGTGPEQADT